MLWFPRSYVPPLALGRSWSRRRSLAFRVPRHLSRLLFQAIYPAGIIVLVALDRSHIEKAFVEHDRRVLDNFQLGPIPMDTAAAAAYLQPGHGDGNGSSLPLEPELLLVEDPGLGDGDVWEGASTSANEEQKLAGIV